MYNNQAGPALSAFHYLFPSKTPKWNVLQFTHSAKNSIGGEGAMAGLLPHRNMLLGLVERKGGWAEAADRLRFSLFRYKALFVCHCTSDLYEATEEDKHHQAGREWCVCFAFNILLTDCRAGMVRRTQTVYRPGHSLPYPTLVPQRLCSNEGSIRHCPRWENKYLT